MTVKSSIQPRRTASVAVAASTACGTCSRRRNTAYPGLRASLRARALLPAAGGPMSEMARVSIGGSLSTSKRRGVLQSHRNVRCPLELTPDDLAGEPAKFVRNGTGCEAEPVEVAHVAAVGQGRVVEPPAVAQFLDQEQPTATQRAGVGQARLRGRGWMTVPYFDDQRTVVRGETEFDAGAHRGRRPGQDGAATFSGACTAFVTSSETSSSVVSERPRRPHSPSRCLAWRRRQPGAVSRAATSSRDRCTLGRDADPSRNAPDCPAMAPPPV